MKTGRMFWGVLFIVIGALVLLGKAGILSLEWYGAWKFWPLILVFLGLTFLTKNHGLRWIAVALAAACLGIVLVSIISGAFWHDDGEPYAAGPGLQEFVEPVTGPAKRASLSVDAGAGTFVIADTTNQLFTATTNSTLGGYSVTRETRGGTEEVAMRMQHQRHVWRFGHFENHAEMKLNPGPAWDLDIDVGAATVDFDLTHFSVESLSLNTGASTVKLKMGGRAADTRISINAGASSIRIWVPDSVGCEIRADAPLSSKSFKGFDKLDSGYYQTENYDRATRRMEITVDAGVSNIRVTRY